MDVEIFSLCDAATAEPNGKLNLLGTFDSIFVQSVPANHPHAAIALRMRFSGDESGGYPLKIAMIDQDGQPIGPVIKGNIEVKAAPIGGMTTVNVVINLQPLPIPRLGMMFFDLLIGGVQRGRLPLQVRSS